MTLPVVTQGRPPLPERDVELATVLGRSLALRVWRARLPTLRVVRACRYVRGRIIGREAWWDVRLEADDGWCVEGEITDVEPLIDVEAIVTDVTPSERVAVPPARVVRIVRWLLWDELWLAQDRLSTWLMNAEWTEVGDGTSETYGP